VRPGKWEGAGEGGNSKSIAFGLWTVLGASLPAELRDAVAYFSMANFRDSVSDFADGDFPGGVCDLAGSALILEDN